MGEMVPAASVLAAGVMSISVVFSVFVHYDLVTAYRLGT